MPTKKELEQALSTERGRRRREVHDLSAKVDELTKALEEARDKLATKESQLSFTDGVVWEQRKRIDFLRDEVNAHGSREELRSELERLTETLDAERTERASLEARLEDTYELYEIQRLTIVGLREELRIREEEIDALKSENAALEYLNAEAASMNGVAQERIDELSKKLETFQAAKKVLSQMVIEIERDA